MSVARACKLYIEQDAAFEPPVGCGELRGMTSGDAIRFGDALNGNAPPREPDSEITVHKAMGIAMEDLVTAEIVYKKVLKETAVPTIRL